MINVSKRKKGYGVTVLPGLTDTTVHKRYPTTTKYGAFCLLCFHPGPVRRSLSTWTPGIPPKRPC